jgi:alpha-L-fucosidase 2
MLMLQIASAKVASAQFKLIYNKPASKWTEALPLGNGRIGAMVFGGTNEERFQINEGTLWGGAPHDYAQPSEHKNLDQIRRLIFSGDIQQADHLASTMLGKPSLLMPYQPFCDLRLHFPDQGQISDYHRDLTLNDAIAETSYSAGSVEFRREAFISYPDQVLAIKLTASKQGQLTFEIGMDSPQPGTEVVAVGSDMLQLTGQIMPRQNPKWSWIGSWAQPGMRFAALLKASVVNGSVVKDGNRLKILHADSVTLLFSNATSFKNYRDISGDALGTAKQYLERAERKTYDQLLQRHLEDFHSLFSRVELHLGDSESAEPTDQRIQEFAKTDDPALVALYFEYGRYLLISSSRPGGQPANLQGIWNQDLLPAWGSKWTTNINLEMNYWQADTGDLWETEKPLWGLIRGLQVTGAQTAKIVYHSDGWVLHHNTDLWRATTPVDGSWGVWPMGEAWLANQMWDHYEYSGDKEFLQRDAYPAMKGAAEFILGTLVKAPPGTPFAGDLVTNPSTSPENQYLLNGKPGHLTYAATMDLELIRELFENCGRAAAELGVDKPFTSNLKRVAQQLPPLQIGERGQLQEWIEDYAETEPHHRHVSHLYSLYPGDDISLESTPKLAAAARKSLELRGDGSTGWSDVWRMALWARLRNPERAYANLRLLLTESTLPNMFDLCPPFQIDGNLGAPAAITEMLVQSTPSEVRILPALPKEWQNGDLHGVRVRGGGSVSIAWRQGQLTQVTLSAARRMQYRIVYGDKSTDVTLTPGHVLTLNSSLQ